MLPEINMMVIKFPSISVKRFELNIYPSMIIVEDTQ